MNLDEELRAASVKRMQMEDAKQALQAALEDLARVKQERDELKGIEARQGDIIAKTGEVALNRITELEQERPGLAAALEATKRAAFEAMCSVADEQRAGAMFANPMLAVSARFVLSLNEIKDNPAILAAHDRQVAARVLSREAREWAAAVDFKSHMHVAETCLEVAAEYESGEREVPNA